MSRVTDDEPRRRLADAVLARRMALRLSQAQLAQAAGITERTVRQIEHAEGAGRALATMRGVSQALGWTPESLDLIAAGAEPVEASAPKPVSDPIVMQRLAELEQRISDLEDEVRAGHHQAEALVDGRGLSRQESPAR